MRAVADNILTQNLLNVLPVPICGQVISSSACLSASCLSPPLCCGCSAGAGSHLRCFCVEQMAASPGTCFAVSPAVSPAVYLATPAPPHQDPFRGPRFRIPGTAIPYGRAGLSRTKRVLMISWCGKEGFSVPNWDKLQAVLRFLGGIYTHNQSLGGIISHCQCLWGCSRFFRSALASRSAAASAVMSTQSPIHEKSTRRGLILPSRDEDRTRRAGKMYSGRSKSSS